MRVDNPADDYRVIKSMGKIKYYLCERKDNQQKLTLSQTELTAENKDAILDTIEAHMMLLRNSNSSVLGIVEVFEFERHVFFIQEQFTHGTLTRIIRRC